MIDYNRIKAFHNYLRSEFSGKEIEYKYDAERRAEIVILNISDYSICVTVLEEFFDDNEVQEISRKLEKLRLKESIRHGRSKRITVTKFGLELEDYK